MTTSAQLFTGVIIAGGLARRMGGGDKCLLNLAGESLLTHTITCAKPQVANLLLNANGDPTRFLQTGLPIIADRFANFLGPLAGIHAGLHWMKANSSHEWLASFASDTPFFPHNLVEKLYEATNTTATNLVVATSGNQTQCVFALWHISLLKKIEMQLNTHKIPRLQDWSSQQNICYVNFSADNIDPFFNINTPEDLRIAETLIQSRK